MTLLAFRILRGHFQCHTQQDYKYLRILYNHIPSPTAFFSYHNNNLLSLISFCFQRLIMGELAMQKYFVIFLVLVTCHIFLPTQARKIKPTIPTFKTDVNVLSPTLESKVDSSLMPDHVVASLGDSTGDTDAFRPTTPGNSPGVGHRNFGREEDKAMKVVQSPDVKVIVTTEGLKNVFKPLDMFAKTQMGN